MPLIYLGTASKTKAAHTASLVALIDPVLGTKTVFNFKLPPPEERGKTEIDRALVKAEYYFAYCHAAVLAEDDGIYFDHDLPVPTGIDIAEADRDIPVERKLSFWSKLLSDHGVSGGTLKKAYAIVSGNVKEAAEIAIPFHVAIPKDISTRQSGSGNMLNHFMIPDGFKQPIIEFSETELMRFKQRYLLEPLRQLLIKSRVFGQSKNKDK